MRCVRYRERFNGKATLADVTWLVEQAEPAPGWVSRMNQERTNNTAATYLVNGPTIFVVHESSRATKVVTCISLNAENQLRQSYRDWKKKRRQWWKQNQRQHQLAEDHGNVSEVHAPGAVGRADQRPEAGDA